MNVRKSVSDINSQGKLSKRVQSDSNNDNSEINDTVHPITQAETKINQGSLSSMKMHTSTLQKKMRLKKTFGMDEDEIEEFEREEKEKEKANLSIT